MSPPRALGELEQTLLFALVALGDGAHGVELRELIEADTGRAPSAGALHTGYERLERRGLVESWLGEPTPMRGGRPKRHYRLTAEGARALRDSYRRISALAEGRVELLDRLSAESSE
ncbi:MAG TPA: helix-turn-helix transcriptional regulator [Thermoanaerobaculia bacterium]|nr:helix-turn-helix transcriptional regulator [Thermoanaerobaculia bacterium]